MEQSEHIKTLFLKHMNGTASAAEQRELAGLVEEHSGEELEQILASIASAFPPDNNFKVEDWEQEVKFILNHPAETRGRVVNLPWRRMAVAASVVALLGTGIWLFESKGKKVQTEVVAHDVKAPDKTRASITLSNGNTVYLDSAGNGQLAMQNNVQLIKTSSGTITYQPIANNQQLTTIAYNTLSNPRGSKVIQMTLADGSRVWLNAESSVTYPVSFNDVDRKVTMAGEAYFEVVHNDKQPFKVEVNGVEVKDIGTHFNINGYGDEDATKVTLLEGSVKVSASNTETLSPGDQATINRTSNIVNRTSNIDVTQVIAWKNGKFDFGQSAHLQEIMKQISRWYDVDVEYSENFEQDFGGSISKEVNVSELLNKFELTGKVKFKIEGKKITVMK